MIKRPVMLGLKLNYNIPTQAKYAMNIRVLVNRMTNETTQKIIKLFRSGPANKFYDAQESAAAMDASISSQARILLNSLAEKYNKLFSKSAKPLSEKMVKNQVDLSSLGLYVSLKDISGGLSLKTNLVTPELKEVSQALISENVSLIKSISEQYLKDVTGQVMRSISTGKGLADLIPALEKYTEITDRRAREIAYDQTRKAYTAINKQKMLGLGLKEFRWLHSQGSKTPRHSHLFTMNGKIFPLDAQALEAKQIEMGIPEKDRGLPSYPINCHCTMQAVLTFGGE